MKVWAITTLFISFGALANCPDLKGNYAVCRGVNGHAPGSTEMIVTQSTQNRITTYNVSATNSATQEREEAIYKADGKIRTEVVTDPDSGMRFETSSHISCLNNGLSINMEMKLDNESVGYSKIYVTKVGTQLIIDSKNFDGEETIVEKEICE